MDTYDPDIAPDTTAWLDLDEQARIAVAMQAHEGRFPDALHTEAANPMMHASLHAIVETQIARAAPAVTTQTIDRLCAAGLKRHAAIHAVMQVLARNLAQLSGEGARFDREAWAKELNTLTAGEALGQALQTARFDAPNPGMNRAQRRAAKKKKRD